MHVLAFPLILALITSSHQSEFDDADTQTEVSAGCDPGHVYNEQYSACLQCGPGTHATPTSCERCPYNTFSSANANTDCTSCPAGKTTLFQGSTSAEQCISDVCVIPDSTRASYISESVGLKVGDRVVLGTELVFECIDRNHVVKGTDTFYMIVTCTQHNADILPIECDSLYEPEEGNGLICYDNCMRESSGKISRVMTDDGSGDFAVQIEKCSLAECTQSRPVCVIATHTDADVTRSLFACESATSFQAEICDRMGVASGGCAIEKCDKDRCNDPSTHTSGSGGKVGVVAMVMTAVLVWVVF